MRAIAVAEYLNLNMIYQIMLPRELRPASQAVPLYLFATLGLRFASPQALCFRLLRRLVWCFIESLIQSI